MMSNTKTMFENQRSITVKKESYNDRKLIYGKIGDERKRLIMVRMADIS